VEALERQSREHDHAVIALLPVEGDVLVAETAEPLERKAVVRALGFLQAQDIGPRRLHELGDEIDAQAHRIDVPGRDFQAHAMSRKNGMPISLWSCPLLRERRRLTAI